MAVLGSILFKRTLKKFLDCENLESKQGVALIEKLREASKNSISQIIEVIPETEGMHRAVLNEICLENVGIGTEELFLESLDDTATTIRATAAEILAQSAQVHPSKLFKKLHETDVSRTEIIDILAFQREHLSPEQIITNALKLDKANAEKLLQLAHESKKPLDLDMLRIEPDAIESPTLKFKLLRYLGTVDQPEVAQLIARFLSDTNRTVVIEALKALKNLPVKFDASVLLPHVETLSEVEREMALEIIKAQADDELVAKLAPWTSGKSEQVREIFIKLLIRHATGDGLEKFLLRLEQQEWYGKEQALKTLQRFATDKLFAAAEGLTQHDNEFVRDQAQQLSARSTNPADLKALWQSAMHDNWQVRETAIEALGRSASRESVKVLRKVIKQYPESAVAVLKALTQLGFGKGLEIAFGALRMPEALVQREALETIGKLVTPQYARAVRDKLVEKVPKLQATVRDTAGEVVNRLTEQYQLPALHVDQETFFETRLTKIEETQMVNRDGSPAATAAAPPADATQEYQRIEEFKEGDFWMNRYLIGREIGRGAMGRVMLAEDTMVGEPLILKFMHPELTSEEGSRERFLREVKYSRKVSHPNVIRIHDMLSQNSLSAISMEFFESRGIDELLREQKSFGAVEGLEVLLQVALGMAAAHAQEVIHRDLKPSNILINKHGLVKIVDFGIASAGSQADASLTKTGSIIGTPAYLSPERAKGQDADHRSDIYALGIIAYGMFAGKLPYSGEPMSLLFQHLEGKAVPLHEVDGGISQGISQLVQKMMAVELEDRFQTMDAVAAAIEVVLDEERQ